MSDVVATARQQLLEAGEIAASDLDGLLGRLMSHRIDTGELFFQTQRTESWTLEDGRVRDGGFSVDRGVGVRVVHGTAPSVKLFRIGRASVILVPIRSNLYHPAVRKPQNRG